MPVGKIYQLYRHAHISMHTHTHTHRALLLKSTCTRTPDLPGVSSAPLFLTLMFPPIPTDLLNTCSPERSLSPDERRGHVRTAWGGGYIQTFRSKAFSVCVQLLLHILLALSFHVPEDTFFLQKFRPHLESGVSIRLMVTISCSLCECLINNLVNPLVVFRSNLSVLQLIALVNTVLHLITSRPFDTVRIMNLNIYI